MLHHLTQHKPHSPFPPSYCHFLPDLSHYNWLQKCLSASSLKFLHFSPLTQLNLFLCCLSWYCFIHFQEGLSVHSASHPKTISRVSFCFLFFVFLKNKNKKHYTKLNCIIMLKSFSYRKKHKSYLMKSNLMKDCHQVSKCLTCLFS